MSGQGSSSKQLSTEDRRAITLGLCEKGNAKMLTDAGLAAQKARYVGSSDKPVRQPVNTHTYGATGGNGAKGQGK